MQSDECRRGELKFGKLPASNFGPRSHIAGSAIVSASLERRRAHERALSMVFFTPYCLDGTEQTVGFIVQTGGKVQYIRVRERCPAEPETPQPVDREQVATSVA